jgi:hypothetical protein
MKRAEVATRLYNRMSCDFLYESSHNKGQLKEVFFREQSTCCSSAACVVCTCSARADGVLCAQISTSCPRTLASGYFLGQVHHNPVYT